MLKTVELLIQKLGMTAPLAIKRVLFGIPRTYMASSESVLVEGINKDGGLPCAHRERNFNKVAEIEDMFCNAFISLSASVVTLMEYICGNGTC